MTATGFSELWDALGKDDDVVDILEKVLPAWARYVVTTLKVIAQAALNSFEPYCPLDANTYKSVEKTSIRLNYCLVWKDDETQLSLEEIIERCKDE